MFADNPDSLKEAELANLKNCVSEKLQEKIFGDKAGLPQPEIDPRPHTPPDRKSEPASPPSPPIF
jgi:hypothetical protein